MADAPATSPIPPEDEFPLPAIICIAIGGYVLLIVFILLIRQCLMQRGMCGEVCNCCGKEGEPQCCECWIGFAEACNCCKNPNLSACLDGCCPARRKLDCSDIILCQCCNEPENNCCSCCCDSQEPLCDCGNCDCRCNCQMPQCDDCNCCCFQLSTHQPQNAVPVGIDQSYGGSPPGYAQPVDPGYGQRGFYGSPPGRGGPGPDFVTSPPRGGGGYGGQNPAYGGHLDPNYGQTSRSFTPTPTPQRGYSTRSSTYGGGGGAPY